MAVLTLYPEVSPATTACDGRVYANGTTDAYTQAGWDVARDATSGSAATSLTTSGVQMFNAYRIYRAFICFDTSSLPNNATITSAKIKLAPINLTYDWDSNDEWVICESTQANANSVTGTDYDNVGTVDWSDRINYSAMTLNVYNDWTLNATGIAAINLTGVTKFSVRCNYDIDDTWPSTFVNGEYHHMYFEDAEDSYTTGFPPALEVTYTLPENTGAFFQMFN